jgi:hypothetical protein
MDGFCNPSRVRQEILMRGFALKAAGKAAKPPQEIQRSTHNVHAIAST